MVHRLAAFGGLYSLVNQRKSSVGWCGRVRFSIDAAAPRQRQHHAQQRIGLGRWRAPDQLLAERFGAAQPAQCVKAKRLHAGSQLRVDIFKRSCHRLAVTHSHQKRGCALQLAPQRNLNWSFLHFF